MRKFVKLNAFAALYGFVSCVQTEIMLNVYRFSRITGMDINRINQISVIIMAVIFTASTLLLFRLTKKHLSTGKLKYLLTILWLPYQLIFTRLIAAIFPITNAGDKANPVTGLLLLGLFLAYPFYIAVINAIAQSEEDSI